MSEYELPDWIKKSIVKHLKGMLGCSYPDAQEQLAEAIKHFERRR